MGTVGFAPWVKTELAVLIRTKACKMRQKYSGRNTVQECTFGCAERTLSTSGCTNGDVLSGHLRCEGEGVPQARYCGIDYVRTY